MNGTLAICLLLVILGAVVIDRRGTCDNPVANRDLAANHLLQTADWNNDSRDGLACTNSDSERLVGRYLKQAVSERTPLDYSKTLVRPALEVRPGYSLFWLNVKEAENFSFIEPGARFDACEGSACPLTLLRAAAIRCTTGTPRLCEVAVMVADADSAKIARIAGKPIRMLFRQEASKGGVKP